MCVYMTKSAYSLSTCLIMMVEMSHVLQASENERAIDYDVSCLLLFSMFSIVSLSHAILLDIPIIR